MANSRRAILPGANSMIFGGINPHKNTLTCMILGRKIPCGIRSFTGDYFMETTNSNYFGTEKISRILLNIISGSRFFLFRWGHCRPVLCR